MPRIRKERAGNDSFGNSWPKDGAVVEVVDGEQVAALMAIPDGGFSEVTPSGKEAPAKADPEPEDEPVEGSNPEFSEVTPESEQVEAPKAPAKKAAAKKTTASKPE